MHQKIRARGSRLVAFYYGLVPDIFIDIPLSFGNCNPDTLNDVGKYGVIVVHVFLKHKKMQNTKLLYLDMYNDFTVSCDAVRQ